MNRSSCVVLWICSRWHGRLLLHGAHSKPSIAGCIAFRIITVAINTMPKNKLTNLHFVDVSGDLLCANGFYFSIITNWEKKQTRKQYLWTHKNSNLNARAIWMFVRSPFNWSELDCILMVASAVMRHAIDIVKYIGIDEVSRPVSDPFFQMEQCHERFLCAWSRHEWIAHSKTLTTTEWCIDRHAYWTVSCLSWSVCPNETTRQHQLWPFQMQSIVTCSFWCHVLRCTAHSTQHNYDDSSYGNISNWYLFLPWLANVECIACKNPSVSESSSVCIVTPMKSIASVWSMNRTHQLSSLCMPIVHRVVGHFHHFWTVFGHQN